MISKNKNTNVEDILSEIFKSKLNLDAFENIYVINFFKNFFNFVNRNFIDLQFDEDIYNFNFNHPNNSLGLINLNNLEKYSVENFIDRTNLDTWILIDNVNEHEIKTNNYIEWIELNYFINNYFVNTKNLKVSIFKRKEFKNQKSTKFLIQSSSNDVPRKENEYVYFDKTNQCLQDDFMLLTNQISYHYEKRKHFSIMRFNDGDCYFLWCCPKGTAGSKKDGWVLNSYDKIDILSYRKYLWQNNISLERNKYAYTYMFTMIMLPFFDIFFKKLKIKYSNKLYIYFTKFFFYFLHSKIYLKLLSFNFFDKIINKIAELRLKKINKLYIYKSFKEKSFLSGEAIRAIISNRWITKKYQNEICLVGNIDKLDLIKKLIKYPEYQNYLGLKNFCDYIPIQAKGSADDIDTAYEIKKQIELSKAKIFLFGIGSIKLALFPLLKDINKIFIDVGCGIDALAGVVSQDRPFFKNWINYQFKELNLNKIDLMDQKNLNRFSDKYKTIYIDESN